MNPGLDAPRILLAEDDPAFAELLEAELVGHGYVVTRVHDGHELLRRLIRMFDLGCALGPADVVISDVRMPGYDGLSVLDALQRSQANLPVVLISAFADEQLRSQAERLGVFAVLAKPFEIDTLLEVVARAVAHARGRSRTALSGSGAT